MSTVFGVVMAACGFWLGVRPFADNSFFWHLRTGRLMLDSGLPHHDPYSFSAHGTAWVPQSWLAEVLYGAIDGAGGAIALRVFLGCVGLGVAVGMYRLALRSSRDRVRASLLVLISILAMLNTWSPRPLMFGLAAMLVLVVIVEEPETFVGRHALIAVPAVMWFWANVHGSFVVGFAYLALHITGRAFEGGAPNRGREWLLVRATAVGALVTLANPYGIDLVLFPIRLMGRSAVLANVTEWQSPSFREIGGMLFAVFLVTTIVALARTGPGARDLLVTVAFLLLALWAVRNIGLAVVVILPILGRLLGAAQPRPDPCVPANRMIVVALLAALVLIAVNASTEPNFDLHAYPVDALHVLEQQQLIGHRLFTTDKWGGYVIIAEWPRQQVFFDDRFDMYPIALNEDYDDVVAVRPGALAILDRYRIDVAMIPTRSPLSGALDDSHSWRRVHRDRTAAVYERVPYPR